MLGLIETLVWFEIINNNIVSEKLNGACRNFHVPMVNLGTIGNAKDNQPVKLEWLKSQNYC